jgi:hypothetical protein
MNMKKILLPFDGSHFSHGAFEFIKSLNVLAPVMVTGIFIPQFDYANLWSYAVTGNSKPVVADFPLDDDEGELVKENMEHFEEECVKNDILFRVHDDVFNSILPELKKESRFSDVVVIGGEMFYKGVIDKHKFDHLRDALHAMECPAVVVPEHYNFPKANILAYDGSEASVFAIKQFAYIFPELAQNETLLVYADNDNDKEIPSRQLIVELAAQHYENLTLYKLDVDPGKYFDTWISERKSSILISGSFSRSAFSQVFKKSFVSDIIKEHKLPVFIAHHHV